MYIGAILKEYRAVLVQEYISAKEYRVLLFDGQLQFVYERIPGEVVECRKYSFPQSRSRPLGKYFTKDGQAVRIPLSPEVLNRQIGFGHNWSRRLVGQFDVVIKLLDPTRSMRAQKLLRARQLFWQFFEKGFT